MHSKRVCQTAGTEQMWILIQANRLSLLKKKKLQVSSQDRAAQTCKPGPILHLHHQLASLWSAVHTKQATSASTVPLQQRDQVKSKWFPHVFLLPGDVWLLDAG